MTRPADLVFSAAALGVRLSLSPDGKIIASPSVKLTDEIRAEIRNRRDEIARHLSRLCSICGLPAYSLTYWNERYCQPCLVVAAAKFDETDTWPTPYWETEATTTTTEDLW